MRVVKSSLAGLQYMLLLLGTTAILFVLLNVAAQFMLNRQQNPFPDSLDNHVSTPDSQVGISVLQRIFKVDTPEVALERVRSAPNFEMHPGLHYMTARTNNKHYRIGLEGIRYDQGWDDERVQKTLRSGQPLVFLMGGSTMLGHGVSGNETISWYLNKMLASANSPATAINFGSQAYDQQREIEKLVYLLREGYRPKQVIFLDGWNDIIGVGRSNMRWQDKVIFHGFVVNRGAVAITPGTRIGVGSQARLLVEALPLTRLLEAQKQRSTSIDTIKVARDPFIDGFDFAEAYWVFYNGESYAKKNEAHLKNQIEESYHNNLQFLNGLSRAFGFELTVMFQPFGLLDNENAFIPPAARNLESYHFVSEMNKHVRSEIKRGKFPMVDASDILEDVKQDRYVDAAHYSPAANERLARFIFTRIIDRPHRK